jgi:hypothetical protein
MLKLKLILYTIGAVLVALAGFRKAGERAGKAAAEAGQALNVAKTLEVARNVETRVDSISSSAVRERLRNDWTRD